MRQKTRGKLPGGAEVTKEGVHFRVWAPKCLTVEVICDDKVYPLEAEEDGYFSGTFPLEVGALYKYRLDGKDSFPDPYSRFQPQGPHGPSQVIDTYSFKWSDQAWKGVVDKAHVVLYELHVGTFTKEGTWLSAIEKLSYLKELGVTVIELMPIHEFYGAFNWGYDGVDFFAPSHHYGTPEELSLFVNSAHQLGLAVILDVVYNHFGPVGNYLFHYADNYCKQELTEWGVGVNFDEKEVRAFFIANACYWVDEFHFDGIRLDACHAIVDTSEKHILEEIGEEVRKKAASREVYLIAENESQISKLALPSQQGGYGLDAVWCEDFHHAAYVRLVGHRSAYFLDYFGKAQEFVSLIKQGFLYQGQWYSWQQQRRGSPTSALEPFQLINFLENHDQVANAEGSRRLIEEVHPGDYRAMCALLLLAPQTPLIFQGQEYGETSPFYYFSDMGKELSSKVYQGRKEFLEQFERSFTERVPLPNAEKTFLASKLTWQKKEAVSTLFKDLLTLRKTDPLFSSAKKKVDGAVFNEDAGLLRYSSDEGERLLLFNFGLDLLMASCPEPLLAPPGGGAWKMLWTSEMEKYGGAGYMHMDPAKEWKIGGHSIVLYEA